MTVRVNLTIGQLLEAIGSLSLPERAALREVLDAELTRAEIRQRFMEALENIWNANKHFTEREVEADVRQAIQEIRATRRAASSA